MNILFEAIILVLSDFCYDSKWTHSYDIQRPVASYVIIVNIFPMFFFYISDQLIGYAKTDGPVSMDGWDYRLESDK